MTTIDYAIIFLILFFSLLSYSRGIVAEVVFILKWLFSTVGARLMYEPFSDVLFDSIKISWLKQTLGFSLFFLIFYIILSFLGSGLTRIVRFLGLGEVNHLLGVLFGALKGVIVVMLLVFIGSYTSVVEIAIWKNSVLLPYFNQLILLISPFVQDMLNSKVNISSDINQILQKIN